MTELDCTSPSSCPRGASSTPPTRSAHWRDEFHVADPELAYLDGNSLGMPPRRTLERVADADARRVGRRV